MVDMNSDRCLYNLYMKRKTGRFQFELHHSTNIKYIATFLEIHEEIVDLYFQWHLRLLHTFHIPRVESIRWSKTKTNRPLSER